MGLKNTYVMNFKVLEITQDLLKCNKIVIVLPYLADIVIISCQTFYPNCTKDSENFSYFAYIINQFNTI